MSSLEEQRLAKERRKVVKEATQPPIEPEPPAKVETPTQKKVDEAKASLTAAATLDKNEARRREQQKRKDQAKRSTTPQVQPVPGRKTTIHLTETADKLHDEAGFVPKTRLGQKTVKTTVSQLKARLGLALIEPILGAVEEGTFGLTAPQSRGRPATAALRITGAIATPTAVDALVGVVLQKLTISTKARSLLKKLDIFIQSKIDPLDAVKVSKGLSKADIFILKNFDELGSPRLLDIDTATELDELLNLGRPPTAKEFEKGYNKFRDAKTSIKGYVDERSVRTTVDDLLQQLKDAFKKSVSLDDPQMAARAWEEGETTRKRLSQIKIGPEKLPLLEIDFPGSKFEAGGPSPTTEEMRNAIRMLDLGDIFKQGSKRIAEIKNFIELNTGTRRAFTTLAPPDLTKIPNAANDLINFIDNNPTVFQDGALFSWMLSGMTPKDAKKVLDATTSLPTTEKNRIIKAIEASGPPSAFQRGKDKKGPPGSFEPPEEKKDEWGSFSIYDVPPWAEDFEEAEGDVQPEDDPDKDITPPVIDTRTGDDKETEKGKEKEGEKGDTGDQEREKTESEGDKEKDKDRGKEKEESDTDTDTDTDVDTDTDTDTEQMTDTEQQTEQELEEEPEPTPPLKLTEKEKKDRRKLNLALFSGKKQLYRVNYQYKGGRKETIGPLEARSLPDALGKAQRIRSGNKTLPTVITVTFIGEKKK